MKKTIIGVIACLFTLAFTTNSEAQILDRLKKKAQDAAERKVEQKIESEVVKAAEQMVERSWHSIFGETTEGGEPGKSSPFFLNSNVTTEDSYKFDIVTTMQIETIKKNGEPEPPVIMAMHFNKNEMYTGTRFESEEMHQNEEDVFIIYDFKNSAMVMLMSNKEDKFSFAYDWKEALEQTEQMESQQEEVNWDEVQQWHGYKKVGTKNIAGYSCDGYLSNDKDTKTEIWVTREETYGMENMFIANTNAKQMKGKIPDRYPYGMLMEMTTEDLKTGDKTVMKVTDITKNANVSYQMADYPIMSLHAKEDNK